MLEMYLRQPWFTYSAFGRYKRDRIQKFKGTWDSRYIYYNELH